jgi:hypothetical protein
MAVVIFWSPVDHYDHGSQIDQPVTSTCDRHHIETVFWPNLVELDSLANCGAI